MSKSIYNFTIRKIDGSSIDLGIYRDKAMLIVNVASECGLTPQYAGLEKVYEKYQEKGLVVLGFPANEFGAQEPGTNEEIHSFCVSKFGVKFPMFEKIVVKGEGQHPLYAFLTSQRPEATTLNGDAYEEKLNAYGIHREKKDDILWNFEKFLVSKTGEVIARFSPEIDPGHPVIVKAIEAAL